MNEVKQLLETKKCILACLEEICRTDIRSDRVTWLNRRDRIGKLYVRIRQLEKLADVMARLEAA